MNRSAYVLLVDPSGLNGHGESFCNAAEEWLDENEGNDISIAVRLSRENETAGVYFVDKFGLKSLDTVPKHISQLVKQALEHGYKSIENSEPVQKQSKSQTVSLAN